MITRQQNVRNFHPPKVGWPRVLRTFEEIATETVIGGRLRIAEHPRQQSHHRIYHDHRRDRAIGQHIIANRNLVIDKVLDDAMIDSLVVTANNDRRDSVDNSEASF